MVTHSTQGLNTEGLLRQEGKLTRVEDLKRKFDKGMRSCGNVRITMTLIWGWIVQSSPTDVDLLSYQIHDVASVLRCFFRELPEPVIPFDLYDSIIDIQRDGSLELDQRIQALQAVLSNLSRARQNLLFYLVDFLQDIREHSGSNKMTTL